VSKEQLDAIDAALRAAPFDLEQSTEEHRKTFDGFALQPYPADVSAAEVSLGGVPGHRAEGGGPGDGRPRSLC
jgi:hypothetical protein